MSGDAIRPSYDDDDIRPSDERQRRMKMRISTRPQDWAAPARAYLFGLHTLNPAELEYELRRMSGGRLKYGERS